MIKGHFWFSKGQEKNRKLECSKYRRVFAMINGEEIEYTEMRIDGVKTPIGRWDDYQYLGYGHFSRTEK